MKLSSLLPEQRIALELKSRTLRDATEEILRGDKHFRPSVPIEGLLEAVRLREEQGSTASGHGVGLPHARVPGLDDFYVFLGVPAQPLEDAGLDGRPVELVFVILGGADKAFLMLQTLGAIASLSQDRLSELRAARTPREAWGVIDASGATVKRPLRARDLMCGPRVTVGPECPMAELLDALSRQGASVAVVVDAEGKVAGCVSSAEILGALFPDYMSLLHDLSFLADSGPFQQFFEWERNARVADIMSREPVVASADDLLVEVLFMLHKRRARFAFVEEGSRVVGMIDRDDIISGIFRI